MHLRLKYFVFLPFCIRKVNCLNPQNKKKGNTRQLISDLLEFTERAAKGFPRMAYPQKEQRPPLPTAALRARWDTITRSMKPPTRHWSWAHQSSVCKSTLFSDSAGIDTNSSSKERLQVRNIKAPIFHTDRNSDSSPRKGQWSEAEKYAKPLKDWANLIIMSKLLCKPGSRVQDESIYPHWVQFKLRLKSSHATLIQLLFMYFIIATMQLPK